MTRANIPVDDRPMDRRMVGNIDTATVDAVTRFILERDRQARAGGELNSVKNGKPA